MICWVRPLSSASILVSSASIWLSVPSNFVCALLRRTLLYACTTLSTPSFAAVGVEAERLTRMKLLSRADALTTACLR